MEIVYLENIKKMCRICFETKNDTHPLFTNKDDFSINEKLVEHAKLDVHMNDGGPASICGQCYEEFNVFVTFLDKCKSANEMFYQFQQNLMDTSCVDSTSSYSIHEADENTENASSNANETCKPASLSLKTKSPKSKGAQNKSASHTCHLCCKVFTRKFNYKLHLQRHSGERDWACAQCGAPALTRALALRHCAPSARKACPAPGCGKSFTSVTNLNTHIRKHNGERPFSCGECGKTFGSKNTLTDHSRIHTGVKPYVCAACGKQFATNKLAAHMRTHAARAHACGSCPRRFPSARAARLHARTHAPAARDHACGSCGARYSHKQSLNKHLRKRHGLKTS